MVHDTRNNKQKSLANDVATYKSSKLLSLKSKFTTNHSLHQHMEPQENLLTDIAPNETEASDGQRIAGNIIDFALEIAPFFFLYKILPDSINNYLFEHKPVSNYVVAFVLIFLYRFLSILLLQRTIGMIICSTKYLNKELQPLSGGERLLIVFLPKAKGTKVYKS